MRGPGRNQKMIVFAGGKAIDVFVGVELNFPGLRRTQICRHLLAIHVFFQPKVDASILARVEKVVAFVLRVRHPELFLDILRQRMHLKGEVSAIHGVEKIKADRKFCAKTSVHRISQQLPWMLENQVDRWDFNAYVSKAQQQAVFLWNAVETPCVVLYVTGEIADLFHPLPAPRPRIKEGNYAEGPMGRVV